MVVSLDMRTLSISAGLAALFCCLPMVYVLGSRKSYPGMAWWAVGTVSASLGLVLLGFRGAIPDVLSIVAANAAIVGFVVLSTQGLLLFVGRKPPYVLDGIIMTAMVAALSVFVFAWPSYAGRVAVICGVYVAYCGRSLVILFRDFPRLALGRNWLLTVTFGVSILWYLARMALTIVLPPGVSDRAPAYGFQALSTILALGAVVAVTSGFVISSLQRMRHDLTQAESQVKILSGMLPTCSNCHRIRDEEGRWINMEAYVHQHSEASFTHGLCDECAEKLHQELFGSRPDGPRREA
jgi:hypothetical protein